MVSHAVKVVNPYLSREIGDRTQVENVTFQTIELQRSIADDTANRSYSSNQLEVVRTRQICFITGQPKTLSLFAKAE